MNISGFLLHPQKGIFKSMETVYKTKGVCSSAINIDIENGIINSVQFIGGCNGNLQGITRLVTGKSADDVIKLFEGIKCDKKNTSCPDQLAKALRSAVAQVMFE